MTKKVSFRIIALEGHDGVGKTTLAKALAVKLNGVYVRPFGGQFGVDLIEAAQAKKNDKVLNIGRQAIEKKMMHNNVKPLIFDRHWITVLSLLPKDYQKCWPDVTHTFLCTASLETIKKRLDLRLNEEKFNDDYHLHYLNTYLKIAKKCKSTVLQTDKLTIEEALNEIQEKINQKL